MGSSQIQCKNALAIIFCGRSTPKDHNFGTGQAMNSIAWKSWNLWNFEISDVKKMKNVHEQNFYVEANNNKKVVMQDKKKVLNEST